MRGMGWMVAAVAACALALPAVSAAEPAAATGSQKFGAEVKVKKPVSVAKLQKSPARFVGKTLRIEGVVKDVCQGMGCWVEVEGPEGTSFMARSLDESVLLPKDCKGSRIVVQGVVTALNPKGHQHEAHAEMEAGHSCPSPAYVLSTQGVELIAKK